MSGFAPRGYFRFAEIRDIIGRDEFGGWLASGEMVAHVLDDEGNMVAMDDRVWRTREAADLMDAGQLTPPDGSEPFPLYVASANPEHLTKIMAVRVANRPALALATGQPAWWPAPDESVSAWAIRRHPEAEAERRIKAAGVAISEGRKCGALTVMWREAGGDVGEDTIARVRRRA